jgi:hypothetical protein
MATAVDMTDSITGMVTKPVEEYRHGRRRRERERKREQSAQNSSHAPPQTNNPRASPTPSQTSSTIGTTSTDDCSTKQTHRSLAGTAAVASAKSISMIAPIAAKGMLVDIPLAITEGLRAVPQHLGTKTRHHINPVIDAKSGAAAAGKAFAWGFVDGLSDLVMEPVRGARDGGGAAGAVKGVGKGAVSLVAKSGAGMFGLFAYPSAGIAKSIRSAVHCGTAKVVAKAKHEEGRWLLGQGGLLLEGEGEELAGRFRELLDGR